jgi:hypothetical protein
MTTRSYLWMMPAVDALRGQERSSQLHYRESERHNETIGKYHG